MAPAGDIRQSVGSSKHRHRFSGVPALKSLLVAVLLTVAGFLLTAARPPAAAAAGDAPAAQNPLRGKILFLRCASCHDVTEGYKYSPALKSQNFVWDTARLDAWMANPNAVAPGTAMAFAGIPEAADRQAIIGYLETQGDRAAH